MISAGSVPHSLLRRAVFESNEWREFYKIDNQRLRCEGKKQNQDAINRAVFAKVSYLFRY